MLTPARRRVWAHDSLAADETSSPAVSPSHMRISPSNWRIHLAAPALGIVMMLATNGAPARAQVVAPPVVEHSERAASTFDVQNQGVTPLTVIIEPFAFWVDTLGEVHYSPFDSAGVTLKLSTMSLRLPPRATYSVSYEASARRLPAWFVVTSSFAGPRTQGLNVRLQLPHVVYLNQKEPLAREDVVVRSFVYDSVHKKVRFKIENVGSRLGRCSDGSVRGFGSEAQGVPSFPLFPHFIRWVEMPWPGSHAPERLELRFEKFSLQFTRQQFVAKG